VLTVPIRSKWNRRLRPIIEESIGQSPWRSEEQVAVATHVSVPYLRKIRSSPATIPLCDLYPFIKRLGPNALYEFEVAWVEIGFDNYDYRQRWGWALNLEAKLRSVASYRKVLPLIIGIAIYELIAALF
jgi:hypothetical protein